ncbi:hypothetical protein D3C80_978680 [compost metagenome]
MPERIFQLVIRLGNHQREIGLLQDRRAEHLVAGSDTRLGKRQDIVFDDVEKPWGKGGGNGHEGSLWLACLGNL